MSYKLVFNTNDCIACNACVMACIDQNDTQTDLGEASCRKSLDYEPRFLKKARLVSCQHCKNAKCIEACPNRCIYRDEETGFVVYDDSRCTGCGKCKAACAFDAIHLNLENRIRKCDGCSERVKHSMQPSCALVCPTKAIILEKI